MNQKIIKIPISCGKFVRIIGLCFVALYYIAIIPTFGYNSNFDLICMILPIIVWVMTEFINYATDRFFEDEPILPFTFKCKCDEND